MNATQKLVSEYVRNSSPVPENELEGYLRENGISKSQIKRVLVDEIIEHTLPSKVSILSPFKKGDILPTTLKYKALTYDEDILVRELIEKRLTGLIPSDTGHSCIKPSPTGPGLLPSPDTEISITRREYYFCPTEESKFKFLHCELYQ